MRRSVIAVAVGVLLALLTITIMAVWSPAQPPHSLEHPSSPPNPINVVDYAGAISTSTDGSLLYTNERIGLSFTFPRGWNVDSNSLGYGSLQLFNYDASSLGKDTFAADAKVNRINAVLGYSSTYEGTEYPRRRQETHHIEVNGQEVIRQDIEFVYGGKVRIYFVPVPFEDENYLSLLIAGNPENFHVLDELVESLVWLK